MTEFTETTPTSQVTIPKSKGKLQNRITLLLIAILIPILLLFAWYDITTQRRNLEALILERAEATAVTGAATISNFFEHAIENGELTREEAFDRDYQPFWEFDPSTYEFEGDPDSLTKYHTAYDAYTDQHWQEIIDPFLGGEDLTFAVPVDVNGYLPTHNTIWSSWDGSPATDRSKRIFDDPVGIKAAQNTEPIIQQVYDRPGTGEILWDVSAPIYVDGEHWGAFRVGVALAANQERIVTQTWQTIVGLSMVIGLVALFSLLMGRYISAPIIELTSAATQTAGGNFSQQVNIQNRQEISTLAYAFNIMTEQLRDLIGNLENRVAARTQDLNLAAEIGRQITQARDVNEVLYQATTSIMDQFNLYQVQIYLKDSSGKNLILRASDGFAGTRLLKSGHTLAIDEYSLNGSAAIQKEAVIVSDTQKDPQFRPHPLLPDTRAEMVVPIMLEDEVLGVMDLQSSEVNGLTEEVLPAFTVLAGQMAIAIVNARQNRSIQENQRLMRTIIDASPDWIFVKNQEHRYQLVNQAYATSFHMTPEDFIDKNDLDLGFSEDIVKGNPGKGIRGFWPDDQEVMDSKQMKLVPEEPGEVDGQPVVLQTVKAPLIDDTGEATGVVGFVHDITHRKQAENTIARRAEELQTVAELSTAVAATNDPQQVIQDVVDLAKERFSLYHAHIYLLDEAGENLVLAAGAGEAGATMVAEGRSIPLSQEQSLVARAARDQEGVIVNDVTADPGFLPNPLLPETRSEMAVPMITGNEVLGVLDVQSDLVDRFTDQDVQIQSTLAAQTAVALQNARQSQQVRAALQEADTFRRLVEGTRQGIGIADPQGNVYYINQGMANLVGKKADEMVGNPMFGLYPADIQARFQQEIIPAVLTQGQWEGELRILAANGAENATYENYFILPDEEGRPAFIAAIITDISEQKATEEAILANQTLMRSIIDATPDWIIVKSRQNRYLHVNQAFADYIGMPVEEMIGKNDLEVGFAERLVYGDPEAGLVGFWDEDQGVMDSGETHYYTNDELDDFGVFRYNSTIKEPLRDKDGTVIGLVIFVHDSTSEKLAEDEQKRLAQEMQEQLEQVSALQRAMTREGWAEYIESQQKDETGFAFNGTSLEPFNGDSLKALTGGLPVDIDLLAQATYDDSQTAVLMPLELHNESIGVVGVRNADGEPINAEQQALLTTLIAQVAEALDRARLFEETETARSQTEALFTGSQQVVRSTNINEILQALVQATALKNMDSVSMLFFDEPWQTTPPENIIISAVWNNTDEPTRVPVGATLPLASSPVAQLLERDNPVLMTDITTDPRLDDSMRAVFLEQYNIQSFIAIPLVAGEQWLGFVFGTANTPHFVNDSENLQIISLAGQAATVAQSQRLYADARTRAEREQILRQVSDRVYAAPDAETVLRTAAREIGQALGLETFIYLDFEDTTEEEETVPANGNES